MLASRICDLINQDIHDYENLHHSYLTTVLFGCSISDLVLCSYLKGCLLFSYNHFLTFVCVDVHSFVNYKKQTPNSHPQLRGVIWRGSAMVRSESFVVGGTRPESFAIVYVCFSVCVHAGNPH